MRQAVTYATDVADDVVHFAYRWSGSDGLRDDHPLGRYLRDMSAATQHMFVDPNSLVDAGRVLMDEWAGS
jgi:alkylation response protein AidB-like acyl-CoA dehydrogenase